MAAASVVVRVCVLLPVIALIGRPNVGKSTLFNRLTRSRDALVADYPGLTRDRQYGNGQVGERPYLVVDTGGLVGAEQGLDGLMAEQVWMAVEEADAVLLLLDARDGLNVGDEQIAARLRRRGKNVYVVLNKADGQGLDAVVADAFALGLGEPAQISAEHGRGVVALMERVLAELPAAAAGTQALETGSRGIRIAVVGRPNVGKSTLINRMLGEQRVLAYDQPGTTRDSIYIPFSRDGEDYTLIDTAGVRRRSRVDEAIEKFSVIKTLGAIDAAAVVIAVLAGWLPIAIAGVVGATVMVLTGCLNMEQAYRAIDWRAIFLIAGMLPLGTAMAETGAATYLADQVMVLLGDAGPWPVIMGLYVLTAMATMIIPTAALVVLMSPIVLSAMRDLGVAPETAMMAVAMAASASFTSPISHPANILVMGPGGYRFVDYLKVGVPLTIVVFITVMVLLPILWPLQAV